MKYYGIVCEFNPFHTGHKYLIEQTKAQTDADAIVCVMSGSMVQRGDVSIYDKWTRAKAAIENGADLVIELPSCYVLQSADIFARGAVCILDSIGAKGIAFGSECTDESIMYKLSELKLSEPEEFKAALKNALDTGVGYPAAWESAAKTILGDIPGEAVLPNSTLGISYISAIKDINSKMDIHMIKRIGDYHSEDTTGTYASASAIRKKILSGDKICDFSLCTSDKIYDINKISSFILGFFRTKMPHELEHIAGMEPGLSQRLIEQSKLSGNLDEFIANCTTKRYTSHRIRRLILCSILGITDAPKPEYARVLALNSTGAKIIKEIKGLKKIEVITKITNSKNRDNIHLKQDILATDIASLCVGQPASLDYTTTPCIL